MNIVETPNLDLISPFPMTEIPRTFGWIASARTTWGAAKSREEVITHMQDYLPRVLSFGIIDRNNWLGMNHQAPLVGIIAFESQSPFNGYLHIATTRRAWGTRIADQAAEGVINHLFSNTPDLLRLSVCFPFVNQAVRGLVKRLGFFKEAVFEDFLLDNGSPVAMAHYGQLKRKYKCHFSPLLPPRLSQEVLVPLPVPLEALNAKVV